MRGCDAVERELAQRRSPSPVAFGDTLSLMGEGRLAASRRIAALLVACLLAPAAPIALKVAVDARRAARRSTRRPAASSLDRNGVLLRPFAIADGRWRLPVDARRGRPALRQDADRLRGPALPRAPRRRREGALPRRAASSCAHGRPVSGASTLTMQVARLLSARIDAQRSAASSARC